MADSLTQPAKGYLFRFNKDGFTELLSFSGESRTSILQKRKSGIIKSEHTYRINIKKHNNICSGFLEDITLRESSSSFPLWPIFELPIDDTECRLIPANSGFTNDTAETETYRNPILKGYADPDVLYHNGVYYLYATSSTLLTDITSLMKTELFISFTFPGGREKPMHSIV